MNFFIILLPSSPPCNPALGNFSASADIIPAAWNAPWVQFPLVEILLTDQDPMHLTANPNQEISPLFSVSLAYVYSSHLELQICVCPSGCVLSHQLDHRSVDTRTCPGHSHILPTGRPDNLIVSKGLINAC